jgi:hypothetical protein
MSTLSRRIFRSCLLAPAIALAAVAVGAPGVPAASAGTSSCLCFHAVYTDLAGAVHDSAYDTVKKTWSDQIAPGSVPAASDPYAVKTADNRYHIVYIDLTGRLHDDFEDPATMKWTDLVPPGSVKADTNSTPVVVDFAEPKGGYTQHIIYVGADHRLLNNQFDPKANSWFDQIPPGSVPVGNTVFKAPSAVDEGGGYFRIVYQGNDLHLHQARFDANATPKTWTDTIVPMSVLANNGLTRVGFATDPTPSFHIVYLGLDGFVHNDREDLGTSTWYDQIPPGSIKAAANSIPTFTLGNDGHPHVLYFGSDGFVHNDNYDPVTKTWFDQIPPGSTFTEASPNGSTTYNNTFPVVYSDGTHIHVDVFNPSTGTWSDTIPTGSAKGIFGRAPAVANTDI